MIFSSLFIRLQLSIILDTTDYFKKNCIVIKWVDVAVYENIVRTC